MEVRGGPLFLDKVLVFKVGREGDSGGVLTGGGTEGVSKNLENGGTFQGDFFCWEGSFRSNPDMCQLGKDHLVTSRCS